MIAEGSLADQTLGAGAELRDHGIDEARVVRREDAEAVADLVIDSAASEVDLDVPGLLFGIRRVKAAAGEEDAFGRLLARAARRDLVKLCGRGGDDRRRGRPRLRLGAFELLRELLERPQGLLSAGRAKIQALLLLQDERVGVVGARTAGNPAAPSQR